MSVLDLNLPWKQLNCRAEPQCQLFATFLISCQRKDFFPTIKTLEIKFDTSESEINSISNKIISLDRCPSEYRGKLQGDYDRIRLFPAWSDSTAACQELFSRIMWLFPIKQSSWRMPFPL